VICKNTVLVPDSKAGPVSAQAGPTPTPDPTEGYTAIASEPADWTSAWTTKYQNKVYKLNAGGTAMEAVTAAEAPTFAANTYYTKD
jgi:hypothetical protein